MVRIIALATTLALGAGSAFAGDIRPAPIEPAPVVRTGGMGYGKYVAMGIGALALGGAIYAIADDSNDDDNNRKGGSSSSTTTSN